MGFVVHHIALSVTDRSASCEFYSRFGFEEVLLWEAEDRCLSITHLALGETILELFAYREAVDDEGRRSEPGNNLSEVGVKHFAVATDSLDEAHAAFADIEDRTAITDGRTGLRYFFVPDPDGLWVEVVQRPKLRMTAYA
jgi:glyoxylase I family protein